MGKIDEQLAALGDNQLNFLARVIRDKAIRHIVDSSCPVGATIEERVAIRNAILALRGIDADGHCSLQISRQRPHAFVKPPILVSFFAMGLSYTQEINAHDIKYRGADDKGEVLDFVMDIVTTEFIEYLESN